MLRQKDDKFEASLGATKGDLISRNKQEVGAGDIDQCWSARLECKRLCTSILSAARGWKSISGDKRSKLSVS